MRRVSYHHRRNTEPRIKGEASASDLVSSLAELDREGRLPEIVVPVIGLQWCPTETMLENDPTVLVRLERLEKAVMQVLNKPPAPAVKTTAPAPATSASSQGIVPTSPRLGNNGRSDSFGPALERAHTLSRSRESGSQSDKDLSHEGRDRTWAERAAAGTK